MAEIQRRFKDEPQIWVAGIVIAVGGLVTVAGSLLNKRHETSGSILLAIGTALLGAACINLSNFCIEHWRYKRYVEPFERFWGQQWKLPAGRILLQSDSIGALASSFAGEPDSAERPEAAWQNRGPNRVFKARAWLNRHDTEAAKEIREVFATKGFDPPAFEAVGRSADLKREASRPFEVWVGLGFTEYMVNTVNRVAAGHLAIKIDDDHGDLLDVHSSLLPRQEPAELRYKHHGEGLCQLLPAEWDHERFLSIDQQKSGMNDYGYILRYRSDKDDQWNNTVLFHLGGFTEHGTWAAGHYLAHHWEDIYRKCVKDEDDREKELAIIVLAGKSPFRPEEQKAYDAGLRDSEWAWWEVSYLSHRDDVETKHCVERRPAPKRSHRSH